MAIPPFNTPAVSDQFNVSGNNACAVWLPCGTNPYTNATFCGIDSTTSVPKGGGLLCTTVNLDDIPITPLFESTIMGIGKVRKVQTSGAKIDDFSLGILGGDSRTLRIMYGQNPSSTGLNAFKPLPNSNGAMGHLIVRKWQPTLGIVVSYFIPNLCIKIASIAAGAEVDTDAKQEVTFYKPGDGDAWILEGNKTVSWGFWKDNAINGAAPNGVLVDFVIGTGNVAGGTGAVSPVPLLINDDAIGSTASNYKRYFFGVWVNGVLQTDAQVSYTTGTRTLTFAATAVPASGAALMVAYASEWTAALNTENFAEAPSSVTSEGNGWQNYL